MAKCGRNKKIIIRIVSLIIFVISLNILATAQKYSDGRPEAILRMDAQDHGIVLRYGDGPKQCDILGARDVWVFEDQGTYYMHYDASGTKGWLSSLAVSKDLINWEKKGPILNFGKPQEKDSKSASYGVTYNEGKDWHMFYLGTPNVSGPPDLIPSFPYLTMKAKGIGPTGPWIKQKDVVPFLTKPGTYYSITASPGQVIKNGDEYLQFFSATTEKEGNPCVQRTLGIARTKNLDGGWIVDPQPMVPIEEQIENSSLYYEKSNKTWFLFTNHIGIDGGEFTDAIWVYWSKDLNKWDPKNKAVVLDGNNCSWSKKCIGLPSVVQVNNKLALFYDAPGGNSTSHMKRNVGLAWLDLPLSPPVKDWEKLGNVINQKNSVPNILLILVDDVGYTDIGAFSAHINKTTTDKLFFETPGIDKLAEQGTMFTQFYACPVCAPTRTSLMTGKMNNRMGMWDAYATVKTTFEKSGKPVPDGCHFLDNEPWKEYNYSKTDRGVSIPVAATALHDVKTIPLGLKGYHSAFIGKWHMGSHNHVGYRPEDQGFDQTLAYFDGGGSGYHRPFRAYAAITNNWDKPGPDLSPLQDYLSDDIAQRTNLFLEDRANNYPDEPFFLYLAHPACHEPIESRTDDLAYFQKKVKTPELIGHINPEYAGLIKGMDRSIGAILDKLDQLKLTDNTVVIFISDNGGHPVHTRNTPLRGGKSMLYEGGIRVPMIVRWPGKTMPGTKCNVTSDVADIFPTLMEIAGIDYNDFKVDKTTDGESLMPLFSDLPNTKNSYTRNEFYQFYGKMGYKGFHNFATWAILRKGDYKLHYDYHGKVELYNIGEDISEKNDLIKNKPGLAYDMLVQLTNWLKDNCNEAYLPVANPNFDPMGELPYGPYVPLEELKASLLSEN
jgi:arylsulfatase A-like enzyme/predicted GH43/DUF377 family glycosyl hydrolase